MALGTNNTVCIEAFVEAMRAQLLATDPESAHKVDNPIVRQNFEAFGDAVFRITVQEADVRSEMTDDPAFWNWLGALQLWAAQASAWQSGVAAAFAAMNPAAPGALADLRNDIMALTPPDPPPAAPTALSGRII